SVRTDGAYWVRQCCDKRPNGSIGLGAHLGQDASRLSAHEGLTVFESRNERSNIGLAQRPQLPFLFRCPTVKAVDDAEQFVRAQPVVGPVGIMPWLGGEEYVSWLHAGQIHKAEHALVIDDKLRRPVAAAKLKRHAIGRTHDNGRVREDR